MKAKHWKKIDSTEVLNHPRMQLIEDTVELPDGKITTYLKHTPAKTHAVAVIATNNKQEILVQREYSYPPPIKSCGSYRAAEHTRTKI